MVITTHYWFAIFVIALALCGYAVEASKTPPQPIIFIGQAGAGKSTTQNHLKYGINECNFTPANTSNGLESVIPATDPIPWLEHRYELWDTPGLDHWDRKTAANSEQELKTWVLTRILEIIERTKRTPVLVFVRRCVDDRIGASVNEAIKTINQILEGYDMPVIVHNNKCTGGSEGMNCETCQVSWNNLKADFDRDFPMSVKGATYAYRKCKDETAACIDNERLAQQFIDLLGKLSISSLPIELPQNWREQLNDKDLRHIVARIKKNRCDLIAKHATMHQDELNLVNTEEELVRKTILEIMARPVDLSSAKCDAPDNSKCVKVTYGDRRYGLFGPRKRYETPDQQCIDENNLAHQDCLKSLPAMQQELQENHKKATEASLEPLNARLTDLQQQRSNLQQKIDELQAQATQCAKIVQG